MSRLAGLFLPLLLLALQACHVPLRPYRLAQPTMQIPPRLADASAPPLKDPASHKSCVDPATPICLAFLEIDDMGELFDIDELHSALGVIRRANDFAATSPGHADPIVLVFVHGWKNNASHGNPNVEGFKAALQEVYNRFHQTNHVDWPAPNFRIQIILSSPQP
jgi:hypothetical protein